VTRDNPRLPVGSVVSGPWELELTVERAGWSWTSLGLLGLEAVADAHTDRHPRLRVNSSPINLERSR
jgi:hypothetical protein